MNLLKHILTIVLVVIAITFAYQSFSGGRPFKMTRTLPKIQEDQVMEILVNYSYESHGDCTYDGDAGQLIHWINQARELKTESGTTSDCRITVRLKDGSELFIWNMYSRDIVTMGYKKGDGYYQSNVYSTELAEFFNDFREEVSANESYYLLQ